MNLTKIWECDVLANLYHVTSNLLEFSETDRNFLKT
jgi:hypothetical protein